MPTVFELLQSGGRLTRQLREVRVEDVLGRDPVRMEIESVGGYLTGRRVLVTGAGGSIGSELCRQIARVNPSRLVLLDHSEANLFEIERELVDERHVQTSPSPCSPTSRTRSACARCSPSTGPRSCSTPPPTSTSGLMEANPIEAVRNNALATRDADDDRRRGRHAARSCSSRPTRRSRPATVMGASKALAEWAVEAANARYRRTRRSAPCASATCSAPPGSVVPIFRRQIAAGGPVTVTDPEMTRFFMTIPEAVQLVIRVGLAGARAARSTRWRWASRSDHGRWPSTMIRVLRAEARARHRDRDHRPPPGREAARAALQRVRAARADARGEDPARGRARRSIRRGSSTCSTRSGCSSPRATRPAWPPPWRSSQAVVRPWSRPPRNRPGGIGLLDFWPRLHGSARVLAPGPGREVRRLRRYRRLLRSGRSVPALLRPGARSQTPARMGGPCARARGGARAGVAEHAEEVAPRARRRSRSRSRSPSPAAAAAGGRAANGAVKLKPEEVAALAFARAAGVHEPHRAQAAPGSAPPVAAPRHGRPRPRRRPPPTVAAPPARRAGHQRRRHRPRTARRRHAGRAPRRAAAAAPLPPQPRAAAAAARRAAAAPREQRPRGDHHRDRRRARARAARSSPSRQLGGDDPTTDVSPTATPGETRSGTSRRPRPARPRRDRRRRRDQGRRAGRRLQRHAARPASPATYKDLLVDGGLSRRQHRGRRRSARPSRRQTSVVMYARGDKTAAEQRRRRRSASSEVAAARRRHPSRGRSPRSPKNGLERGRDRWRTTSRTSG